MNLANIVGLTNIIGKINISSTVDILPQLSFIWTGLGSDNNWSTPQNWNIRVPQSYDILQFAGTTRLAPFNNLTVDTPYNGIEFISGAGAFTLSGNRFVLNTGSISNSSINTQTINNDIVLGSTAGTINCSTSSININGIISGSGTLTKTGSATLILSGNNTYTGNTFINNGSVTIGNSNAFGTGSVTVLSSAGSLTISSNSIPNTVILNNEIAFNNPQPNIFLNKSTTFNGPINFSGDSIKSINMNNSGTVVTFNNLISSNSTRNILFNNHTLNTDPNETKMIFNSPIIFDNTVSFQADLGAGCSYIFNAVGNKINTLRGSGLYVLNVPNAFSQYRTLIALGRRTGRLQYGLIDLRTDQIFSNTGNINTIFPDCSGCNIFNNTSTTSNFTLSANTGNFTYVGSISGNINLIKTGTYTQILSGSTSLGVGPRYTGFTAISAGTLINYVLSSNPSNKVNFAQFTNTALTVSFTTPPVVGDSFILLPARTVNLYPSVTLQNASGRTASYNSTTSTLSIIT